MAKQWLVACGLMLAVLGCRSETAPSGEKPAPAAVVITDANFDAEVGASKRPVLVGFYAADDAACKEVPALAAKLANEFKDKAVVGVMDVKQNPVCSQRYSETLPTFTLFKQGQPIERLPGELKEERLREVLKSASN